MIDYHIHPNYSLDSDGSLEDFCQAAVEKGIQEIAFTTHVDTDRKTEDCIIRVRDKIVDVNSKEWMEDYEHSILEIADRYQDEGLVVLLGAELDIYPGVIDNLPGDFLDVEWDVVIGSVHLIDHQALSLKNEAEVIFSRYSLEDLGTQYFSILLDTIETSIVDILGHVDLYRRFGEEFYGSQILDLWKPHINELSSKMKKYDVGFEINTSSWRRGQLEPLPSTEFISALVEGGVKTITVGSDAHTPNDIGRDIDRATELLSRFGIQPARYRKRARVIE